MAYDISESSNDNRFTVSEYADKEYTVEKAVGTTDQDGAIGSDSYISGKILDGDPYTEEITHTVVQKNLSINGKYLAIGWADWFNEDQIVLCPLLVKYDFQHTFYWQSKPKTDAYLTSKYTDVSRDPGIAERSGSFSAEHMYLHWTWLVLCASYDGRTTPSIDDLRLDRGDGRNQWGHAITATVLDSVGEVFCVSYLQIPEETYNKQWQNLTDSECILIREQLGVFTTPDDYQNGQKMLEGLDYLSNH